MKSSRPVRTAALSLLAAAVALAPLSLSAAGKNYMELFNQARTAYSQGNYSLAEEKVLAALEINPQHPGSIALHHQLQARAPKADIIGTKYNAVKIPLVEFKEATVQSCFEYLKQQASTLSGGKTQVNFVYNLPKEMLTEKRITLRLENVPLLAAVDYIGKLAGAEKRLEKHAIVIAPYDRIEGPVEVDNKQILAARASLRSLVLTSVEFKDTPVAEAFDTLRELATKDSGGKEQPNIIVALPPDQIASLKANLDLKNVPFFEALRLMCEHLDVNWKVGTYGITISPAQASAASSEPATPAQTASDLLKGNESSISGIGKGNAETNTTVMPGPPLQQ